jgi:general secretion pathway protein I
LRKRRIRRARRQSGFTLIEVLVALAIAALGLGVLVAVATTGIGNAGLADKYIRATSLCQSHLAELGFTIPLTPGTYSGGDGEGFRWRVHIGSLESHRQDAAGATALRLYAVTVRESWPSGASWRSVALSSERVGPP